MISRKNKADLMRLCPGHNTQAGAMDEALAALWALRVLDYWAADNECQAPSPEHHCGLYEKPHWTIKLTPGSEPIVARSADEARSILAHRLVIEKPDREPCP